MASSIEPSSSDEVASVATGPNRPGEVADELRALHDDAQDRMVRQRRAAQQWGRMNVLIGVPAALFSGAAGAIAALTDVSQNWKIAVTLLAVVSSGLTSVATTLNASRKSEEAALQAAAYGELVRDARVTLQVDLGRLSYETAREALETLIDRLREIDRIPPRESFYRERIARRTQEPSLSAEHAEHISNGPTSSFSEKSPFPGDSGPSSRDSGAGYQY